jgi:predicted ABC-type ATPase
MPPTPQEIIDRSTYSDADKIAVFNDIVRPGYADRKVRATLSSGNKPVAYILGGQPGAGKSELIDIIKAQLLMNVVECNADNFREYHPQHEDIIKEPSDYYPDLTGKFANVVNDVLVNHCLEKKLNFILETTFSSRGVMNSTIKKFAKRGYIVNVAIMAVNPKLSYLNTMTRYEQMLKDPLVFARKVGVERHDERYPLVEETLKMVQKSNLYDHIYIYGRAGLAAHKNKKNGLVLKYKGGKSALNAYIKERDKQWPDKDKQYFMQRALLLAESMVRRNASMNELRELFHYYDFSDYTL